MSTPTRGCAWPRRSPATGAPSAPTWCRACYDDLDAGRPRRAGRLQCRLVPSGAVTSACSAQRGASAACASSSIDPRRTATGEDADLHLPIAPGTDTRAVLRPAGASSPTRRARPAPTSTRTRRASPQRWRARARSRRTSRRPPRATGLDAARRRALLRLFARARERVVTCYSQGVNQSAQGTDKVNAIINCHLATGRIGKPGAGPLSLTGQPNAMGGREVGGLANQLAAHMGFAPAERRPRAPLLERAAHGRRAKASRPCRCSRRSRAARSRRCG